MIEGVTFFNAANYVPLSDFFLGHHVLIYANNPVEPV